MDGETREAFKDLRDVMVRMEAKMDSQAKTMTDHLVEDAKQFQQLMSSDHAQWRKIDDHLEAHKETRKWWFGLWMAAIVSLSKHVWDLLRR